MTKPSIHYDRTTDAAYIRFSRQAVSESEEVSAGIVLDFDGAGHIVGMEVLDARRRLPPEVLETAA